MDVVRGKCQRCGDWRDYLVTIHGNYRVCSECEAIHKGLEVYADSLPPAKPTEGKDRVIPF